LRFGQPFIITRSNPFQDNIANLSAFE